MKIKNWNKRLFSRLIEKKPLIYKSSQPINPFCSFSKTIRRAIYPGFLSSVLLLVISNSLYAEQLAESSTKIQTNQLESPVQEHLKEEKQPHQNTANATINQENQKEQNNQDKPWLFLHGYEAKYLVQSEGDILGHATRKLTVNEHGWTLATYAKIKKYLFSVKNTETTEFHLDDNNLLTDRFYSKTKITFKKARVMEQNFDWENKLETGKRRDKSWSIPLDKQVFDRVSHIVQMRADLLAGKKSLEYDVSYKGKFHVYSYSEEIKEILQTDMGPLTGIKFVRQKPNGDVFALWLCPELNYLPIKIAQYEQDKADVTLVLESVKYQSD